MKIQAIEIKNFKNLKDVKIKFNNSINIVVAENGKGKSNLLEAISILSNGKPIRMDIEKDIVCWDLPQDEPIRFTKIDGDILYDKKNQHILYYIEEINGSQRVRKELRIDGKKVNRAKFISHFQTLLFDPLTLNLITSSPSRRRIFFDIYLSNLSEDYFLALTSYKKALQNRNRILSSIREGKSTRKELEFWNQTIATNGETILKERIELIDNLNSIISNLKEVIAKEGIDLQLKYISSINRQDNFNLLSSLEENLERDIMFGRTQIGPHRDDFQFVQNKKNAKHNASRGQQRILMIALLFALSEMMSSSLDTYPVLLLDDVLSELDKEHRQLLLNSIKALPNQIIITGTDPDDFNSQHVNKTIAL